MHAVLTTLRDIYRYLTTIFEKAGLHYGHGTTDAAEDARYLISEYLGLPYGNLPEFLDAKLLSKEKKAILDLAQRRIQERIPMAYLVKRAYFAGLPFYVDQRVLIPRSPLAEIIENQFQPWIKDEQAITSILDIGTGSGCLAIASAYAFPEAQIDAVDLSVPALQVAEENLCAHQKQAQITLHQGNCFEALPLLKQYDIILSNPPYVSREEWESLPPEYHHEPRLALEAAEQGLACAKLIVEGARYRLKDDGILLIELGNTAPVFEQAYPGLPMTWLSFERGGTGVCLLTGLDLRLAQFA